MNFLSGYCYTSWKFRSCPTPNRPKKHQQAVNCKENKMMRTWNSIVLVMLLLFMLQCSQPTDNNTEMPEKFVVLTFDDAVKSHRTFVAPLLKELGFGATFFVCYEWMDDTVNFMSWQDIAEIHEMGFEIGNI